ncbi:hypothetical protein ACLOJK_040074 [Asimina triloba]
MTKHLGWRIEGVFDGTIGTLYIMPKFTGVFYRSGSRGAESREVDVLYRCPFGLWIDIVRIRTKIANITTSVHVVTLLGNRWELMSAAESDRSRTQFEGTWQYRDNLCLPTPQFG